MENRSETTENKKGFFEKIGFGRSVPQGERELHIPEGERWIRGIGWAVAAFLLGICRLPFSVFPLGMAFLCASDRFVGFSAVGLALSSFFIPMPWGVYLGAIFLTLGMRILTRLFVDIPVRTREIVGLREMLEHIHGRLFCESLYLRMTCSCVAVFLLSLYAIVTGGFRYYDLFGAFFAMLVAPLATFFYCSLSGDMPVGSVWLSRIRRVAKAVLAFSLCLAFRDVVLAAIPLGMAAAFVATLILCRREGLLIGLLTGALCGVSLGLFHLVIFSVVALTAFCLFEISPYLSAGVSFLVGGVTGVLLLGKDSLLAIFLPLALGATLYCGFEKIMARRSLFVGVRKKVGNAEGELMRLEKQYTATKEAHLALCRSFATLSERALSLGDGQEGANAFSESYAFFSKVFSERLEHLELQYREDSGKTVAVRDKLRELGFAAREVSVCGERSVKIFVSGLSPIPEHKKLLYLQKQLGRTLDASLTFPVLSPSGDACHLYAESAPCFDARMGAAQASCEGVSGDTVSVFEDVAGGYSYALISDGMGTGKEAARISGVSADFLRLLLSVGVERESALRMLNGFLSLGRSSGESECSTTVDLMCLDRISGRASFLKSGASPTYVKRGTNIFKMAGATLPVGILSLVDAKQIEFETRDGDLIVQSSDGVTEGESECLWLLEYLNATDETDPERMAEYIKDAALAHGGRDDVSVIVTKIRQKI
ncbi:MAG: hypothetical protein E7606_01005 [Ruminococcaceae bacterium]|nr:hypothetical protein [Oscillospiraceae bacterium]